MTMVEDPYVWDGGLYWVCETCGRSRHRFPADDYRRVRGVKRGAFPENIEEP